MNNSSVLLTGATGLIGQMLVKTFLAKDYHVIFVSSNSEHANLLELKYPEAVAQGRLQKCIVDLLQDNAVNSVKDYLQEYDIYPNYLINNARKLETLQINDYRMIPSGQWGEEYQLDVVIPYQLSMGLVQMDRCALKAIVNIASMYGMISYNDYLCNGSEAIAIHYGVAKAALLQLTRELAVRLAKDKIRVNAVSFGGVAGRADKAFTERYAKLCPMKKMLSEEEVTGHIMYLCSEDSLGMTGHNLVVDGGFSIW